VKDIQVMIGGVRSVIKGGKVVVPQR
jgi:hypothetical protein